MKVLCLFDTGVDRGECALLIGLKQAGIEPWVICKPNTARVKDLRKAGIIVEEILVKSKTDLILIRHLRSLVKNQDFNLIHAFRKSILSNFNIATIGLRNPPIIAYRGIIGNLSYWDPFSWLTFLDPRLKRIICVCDAVKNYFINKKFFIFFSLFSNKNVVRVYKGHDVKWYSELVTSEAILPKIGIPPNAKVIGCISRIQSRKGIKELIQSIDLINTDHDVHLVIAGSIKDKSYVSALKNSKNREKIHLLGFHPLAARMAAEFDIITLPSLRREGLPRSIIEGMSHGIAPVVTDAGGSPELIEEGVSGLVVPPKDPAALALAFSELLNNAKRRNKIGEAAKQRIKDAFSVEQTLKQTLAIYKEVLLESD